MFESLPIAANLGIFAAAAAAVWFAGARLSRLAEVIAERTGLSREFVGMLLLATATSLPEVATTATAGWLGNARLALNNLTGSVAMQTTILTVADLLLLRAALTFVTPRPVLLLQGTLVILLLGMVLAATEAGEPATLGWMGVWPLAIAAAFAGGLFASRRYEERPGWRATNPPEGVNGGGSGDGGEDDGDEGSTSTTRGAALRFAGGSGIVLVAGWTVASAGDALSRQTGLGGSFVGATLVAASTALPEVSTTVTAVRRGAYGMAISNIFGSNAFCLALLLVADAFYRQGPILAEADRSMKFAAALGVVLTAVYVWGLVERRNRTVLRMGLDSALVLALYAAGLVVLYVLRDG